MNTDIKRSVMLRVRTIYLLRKINIKFVTMGALSLLFIILVDVPSVIANVFSVISGDGSAWGFFSAAFSQSMLLIKLLIIALALATSALARDVLVRFSSRLSF